MPKIRSPENDAEGDGTDPKGMPLNKRLYKLLGDHGPQIGAVVGLLTIGGFGWVGLTWLFAEPDLSVEVSSSEVRLPSALHRQLIEALEPYSSESVPDSIVDALRETAAFLRETRQFTQVSLRNNTDESLGNVEIRVQNVGGLSGWGVAGNAFTDLERQRVLESVYHDATSELLLVQGLDRLPPNSTIEVLLWAEAPFLGFSDGRSISVTFDGGVGELVRTEEVSGLNAFVYTNSALLLLIGGLVILIILPGRAKSDRASDGAD